MKKILLTLMVLATCGMAANAKNYDINIANVEVSDNNCNYITGGDIDSGYGVYNPSTNTLTLYNINIRRTGQDHYGIHNRKCDNLTIVFSGNCNIVTSDNALKLERSTTITAASGSNTYLYSAARIVVNLKSYTYYFKGSGSIKIKSDQSGYEAIKGDGINNTTVYFQGAKITANSTQRSTLSSFTAYFQGGADLRITGNDSDASVSDVKMEFYGKETILEPFGAYYSNNSIYNSSGSQIKSGTIYISDDYVALIDSNNFPDYNFRNYLLGLYPKGYINTSDVNSRTSMSPYSKSISNLKGIEYFTQLTYLDCSYNDLTSLDVYALTKLTRLYCYSNALTSLNVNGCPALITLDCHNNKLTALSVQGLNSLEKLAIYGNQIKETAMGTLVNSLRTIPAGQTGEFQVYAIYDEGNVITMAQVLTARNKRWLPKMHGWTTSQIGDVNRDGYINAADVTALYRNILYNDETYISTSDVNMDNAVNAADVTAVYSFLLGN